MHGIDREQRYGGIDPGKGVDNDFASVVLISLDGNQDELPLVTANWYPPLGEKVDTFTIVHKAISGDLRWLVPQNEHYGKQGVWLIYADFLEFFPPDNWPKEPEYDGGILAYLRIACVGRAVD